MGAVVLLALLGVAFVVGLPIAVLILFMRTRDLQLRADALEQKLTQVTAVAPPAAIPPEGGSYKEQKTVPPEGGSYPEPKTVPPEGGSYKEPKTIPPEG